MSTNEADLEKGGLYQAEPENVAVSMQGNQALQDQDEGGGGYAASQQDQGLPAAMQEELRWNIKVSFAVTTVLLLGLGSWYIAAAIIYKDDPCEEKLWVWLLVQGIASVFYFFFGASKSYKIYQAIGSQDQGALTRAAQSQLSPLTTLFTGCFGIFMLSWFIYGNVLVWAINYGSHYCPDPVYKTVMAAVLMPYTFMGLGCFVACCVTPIKLWILRLRGSE